MIRSDDLQRLLSLITKIADERFQRDAWFGRGTFVSSPTEMLCQYFDDLDAPDFIEKEAGSLSEPQREALLALDQELNRFADATSDELDPAETANDPRWKRIRALAAAVGSAFAFPSENDAQT